MAKKTTAKAAKKTAPKAKAKATAKTAAKKPMMAKSAKTTAKKAAPAAKKATAKTAAKTTAKKPMMAKATTKATAKTAAPKATAKTAAPKAKATAKAAAPAKKTSARKPNAAFMKPLMPSKELGEIVGMNAIPRTEVMKKVWAYIKKHDLQDAQNRRQVNADDKLKAVFGGKKSVTMFEMTKYVSNHLK
jgi:upstream activation factor subunit UAF30